jgi:parallel beta-helix repeat protein
MKRKLLAVGIILLFIETCIMPAIAQDIEKPSLPTSRGNWFYVGGSGPGNYTRIQDAVDNATDGDTVYVFPGTYTEHLNIEHSITLQGADPLTTIIDGQGTNQDIVSCIAAATVITGFTIFNCSISRSCVLLNHTSNCLLQKNIIHTGKYGVTLKNAQNISIQNNSFSQPLYTHAGYIGININNCINSIFAQNNLSSWDSGIYLYGTYLIIINNTITNADRGITDSMETLHPWTNKHLIIQHNILINTKQAIHLLGSTDYSITHNEIRNATSVGMYMTADEWVGVSPENVTINDNTITDSRYGMEVDYGINISIDGNHIKANTLGLFFQYTSFLTVTGNTFEGNNRTLFYRWALFPVPNIRKKIPYCNHNFWDHERSSPQPVVGSWSIFSPGLIFGPRDLFPWVTFDWHPAQEPYYIPEIR